MMLAHANAAMGHVLVLHGEFVAAREYLEKDPVIPGAARRPGTRVSWASWALSPGLSALAWDLWFLGYPDRAAQQLTQALAETEIESDPFWRSSCWFYALRAYVCLRHPQTLDLARSLVSLVKEQGPPLLAGVAPLFVLWAEVEQGLVVNAVDELRVAKAETHQGKPTMSWVYLMMADMCAKVRDATFGLTLVDSGLRVCNESGLLSHKAELLRVNGELLLIKDPASHAEAEKSFRNAIEVARRQSAKSWELRATTSLARLLEKQNRHAEARATLSEIYDWFTEGFDTADLKDAEAVLAELTPTALNQPRQ
jgi:hypothetical protein